MSFDLKRTYFGLVSFVVLMVAFIAGLSLLGGIAGVVVLSPVPFEQRYPPGALDRPVAPGESAPAQGGPDKPVYIEDWELRGARDQLATSLAAVIVALPI